VPRVARSPSPSLLSPPEPSEPSSCMSSAFSSALSSSSSAAASLASAPYPPPCSHIVKNNMRGVSLKCQIFHAIHAAGAMRSVETHSLAAVDPCLRSLHGCLCTDAGFPLCHVLRAAAVCVDVALPYGGTGLSNVRQ